MSCLNSKKRNFLFDNVRAFSIFLVVFGHMLETFSSSLQPAFYTLIYFFHIPLLVFMSGYFAKFDVKKIVFQLLIPLLFFQGLYCLFDYLLFGNNQIQYLVMPFWLLWYLLSLICWRFSVFLLEKIKKIEWKTVSILLAFTLGLAVGYLPFMTRAFSLSRTFVFFPFFLLGYFFKEKDFSLNNLSLKKKVVIKVFAGIILLAFAFFPFFFNIFPKELLYGANCYQNIQQSKIPLIGLRGILYAISLCFIFGILLLSPKKELPILSILSKNSIQIYLLHGFFVMFFKKIRPFPDENVSILYTFLVSLGIVLLITFVMLGIEKCREKIKRKNSP